ncbi:hypothetical protein ACFCVO_14070 [Agromyces sp. NPDC056379]|uniref:hypothetical protein n=1 Tax=unclassified Agromyces TaxID=2639701 RepID=UPI0035D94AA4
MADVNDRAGANSPGPDSRAATDAAETAARITRLQRIAFGADASESERNTAAAELETLQRAEADAAAARAELAAVAGRTAGQTHDDHPDDGPDSSTAFAAPAPAPTDARGIRWAIAAGTVALALGLGVGWQLGGRSVTPYADGVSTAAPDVLAAVPTASATTVQLAETSLPGVLSRPPVESDVLDPAWQRTYGIDLSSARRLLSLPDGLVVFGALRDGDVCLIASYSAADGAPACSTYGIVNSEGLRTAVMSETTATTVRWRPDGTVELTPAGYRLAEPAVADDDEGSAK